MENKKYMHYRDINTAVKGYSFLECKTESHTHTYVRSSILQYTVYVFTLKSTICSKCCLIMMNNNSISKY